MRRMAAGWVYVMSIRPNGILYVGVTNDIRRRVAEHKAGLIPGFTQRHGLKRLVYAERHDDMLSAIQREKNIKHWVRAWKVRLIAHGNPAWDDLTEHLPM
jgi:putative endonuclease